MAEKLSKVVMNAPDLIKVVREIMDQVDPDVYPYFVCTKTKTGESTAELFYEFHSDELRFAQTLTTDEVYTGMVKHYRSDAPDFWQMALEEVAGEPSTN